MTHEDFRQFALEHPDFRVRGKVFATLGYPDGAWGMVKLTPEQQRMFLQSDGAAFVPVKGAWGERGCTNVRLSAASEALLQEAIATACGNIGFKPASRRRSG